MKNVTVRVEEDVARWARIEAARRGTSVSRMVGEMLRERMLQEEDYEAAMATWRSFRPRRLSAGPYPSRDELHER
ncbi:MAG: CopG family transcriptional regulator [Myxococcota bacterium]